MQSLFALLGLCYQIIAASYNFLLMHNCLLFPWEFPSLFNPCYMQYLILQSLLNAIKLLLLLFSPSEEALTQSAFSELIVCMKRVPLRCFGDQIFIKIFSKSS